MAYPTVDKPYGLKPINLIGGQVFAGSTRDFPIQYGYNTNIFYGDWVVVTRGFVNRAAVSTGTGVNQVVGIFLGCTYTSPATKQKLWSQYWPAGTAAGDAVRLLRMTRIRSSKRLFVRLARLWRLALRRWWA